MQGRSGERGIEARKHLFERLGYCTDRVPDRSRGKTLASPVLRFLRKKNYEGGGRGRRDLTLREGSMLSWSLKTGSSIHRERGTERRRRERSGARNEKRGSQLKSVRLKRQSETSN